MPVILPVRSRYVFQMAWSGERSHLRAFVLLPLLDVAPDWVHPRLRRTARDLLGEIGQTGVKKLDVPGVGHDVP